MKADGAAVDDNVWKTLGKQESFINWGNYSRLFRIFDHEIVMFYYTNQYFKDAGE